MGEWMNIHSKNEFCGRNGYQGKKIVGKFVLKWPKNKNLAENKKNWRVEYPQIPRFSNVWGRVKGYLNNVQENCTYGCTGKIPQSESNLCYIYFWLLYQFVFVFVCIGIHICIL